MKKEKYECFRCGYCTHDRSCMRRHLFNVKKPCPGQKNAVVLTDDIKQHILDNRIYKPPKDPTTTTINNINQTINNYNTINNFIASIDLIEKITKYTEHKQLDIVPFSQNVEDKYINKAKRLENNTRNIELKYQDILDIIHDVCNGECKIVEEINVIYDSKVNTIKLYEQGEWQEMIVSKGIVHIIKIIQEYYLDSYEFYLIRKIKSDEPGRKKAYYKELLQDYFKFIACFDIDPYFKNKNDYEILYNPDDPKHDTYVSDYDIDRHSISDQMQRMFDEITKSITKSEINSIKKEIIDIIKKNTKRGMDEVNKKVLELFNIDETFKKNILNRCN